MGNPSHLIIIGGGEHARVVAEVASSRPDLWQVVAFVSPEQGTDPWPAPGVDWIAGDEAAMPLVGGVHVVLGIGQLGAVELRRRLAAQYDGAGALWAPVVHSTAWVSPTAHISPGVVVMAGAIVNAGASIAAHAVINTGAIVEHDVVVGPFAVVSPGVVIGGGSRIGGGTYLGLGCRVRDHVEIGDGATVGMGAVVVKGVRPGACVMGVPARERRIVGQAND